MVEKLAFQSRIMFSPIPKSEAVFWGGKFCSRKYLRMNHIMLGQAKPMFSERSIYMSFITKMHICQKKRVKGAGKKMDHWTRCILSDWQTETNGERYKDKEEAASPILPFKQWTQSVGKRWVIIIPDICQFWYTTPLFRPVKLRQKVHEFSTKLPNLP